MFGLNTDERAGNLDLWVAFALGLVAFCKSNWESRKNSMDLSLACRITQDHTGILLPALACIDWPLFKTMSETHCAMDVMSRCYEVTFEREENQALGILAAYTTGSIGLVIFDILPSADLVHHWNEEHREDPISIGQAIIKINGSDDIISMMTHLQSSRTLKMLISNSLTRQQQKTLSRASRQKEMSLRIDAILGDVEVGSVLELKGWGTHNFSI